MKYQLGSNGKYLEESGERIESSFISEDNLRKLIKVTPLAKLTIYEEDGSDEFSEAECLQNEKITDALNFVKSKFIDLINKTKISPADNTDELLIETISEFRSITNLFHLLEIKHTKYRFDDSVVVKLG